MAKAVTSYDDTRDVAKKAKKADKAQVAKDLERLQGIFRWSMVTPTPHSTNRFLV